MERRAKSGPFKMKSPFKAIGDAAIESIKPGKTTVKGKIKAALTTLKDIADPDFNIGDTLSLIHI